jgi:hypothetical protein
MCRERLTVKMANNAPTLPTFRVSSPSQPSNEVPDQSNPIHSIELPFAPNNSFAEVDEKDSRGKAEAW